MYPRTLVKTLICIFAAIACGGTEAHEYPIGKPVINNGMEVSAVYLQPITMDPPGMMRKAEESDIHLETDIHATKGNANGYAEGDWIPYLLIRYELQQIGTDQKLVGTLMPMVANDGPHYGDNVKLPGAGKYHVKFIIMPPSADPMNHFGRHVDKETGVGPWFNPFDVEQDFTFAGIGKKGGY